MQIVIDVPNEEVPNKQEIIDVSLHFIEGEVSECTYPYIVLPKGHGRLGDLDALETEMVNGIHAGNYEEGYEEYGHINNMDGCVDCVRYADTIIEADKAESEEEE